MKEVHESKESVNMKDKGIWKLSEALRLGMVIDEEKRWDRVDRRARRYNMKGYDPKKT